MESKSSLTFTFEGDYEVGESIIIENKDGSKMKIPVSNGVYLINPVIDQSITGIFAGSAKSCGVSGVTIAHGKS